MHLQLSEEQRLLADTTRRLLGQHHHVSRREAGAAGSDTALWTTFAEAGLLSLLVPEAQGGLGAGGVETHIVMEEMGRALVAVPYPEAAVMATSLIADLASPAQRDIWLPAMAEGHLLLVPALAEPQTGYGLSTPDTAATRHADGFVLNGHKSVVVAGDAADGLLVSARAEEAVCLFHVPRDAPGVRTLAYPTIHGGTAAEITFDGVRVGEDASVGAPGAAWPAIAAAADRGAAALCAESVGIMTALFEATLAYVKQRRQFGATVGSFQAVQHQLVDALLLLEEARSLAWLASSSLHLPPQQRGLRVSAAKHKADVASRHIAEKAVQLHGGMGMTDELPIGRYMRRLIAIQHTLGDADFHLRRFAASGAAA